MFLVGLGAGMLPMGCGSDSTEAGEEIFSIPDGVGAVEVDTAVSKTQVKAGESVLVTCTVTADAGEVDWPTEVVLTIGGVSSRAPSGVVSLEKAGLYDVACAVEDSEYVDPTPAQLEVLPGNPVKIVTSLDPTEIGGGEVSNATCTATDAYGNTGEIKPGVKATPAEGLTIVGQEITGGKAGTFDIACKGDKGVEVVSATLTVVPGVPARFRAIVSPDTVEVAQSAQVSCQIEDAGGNPRTADWKVSAPEEVTVSGTSIQSTVAGTYKVKCEPVTGTGDEELVPADFTVTPGAPVGMNVYAKPAKDHYTLADQLTVKHELVDAYDNVIGDAEIEPIVVVPEGGMELLPNKDDKFKFLDEGIYKLTVKALEYPYSGELQVICDGTGPIITITYPPRALTISGATSLVVTGYVEDKVSEVTSLTVNGEAVEMDEGGAFSYPMTLVHDMNLIAVKALDSWGNEGKRFTATFYSTQFKAADKADPQTAMIPKAIQVFLSQEFIDDGDHSQPPDDLATIVESVVAGFDFASMLPEEGIEFMSNCEVYITNVQMGKPHITLESGDGGMHLYMEIPDFIADLTIACCYHVPIIGNYCDDYYGIIYADKIILDAYIFVGIGADGKVDASLGPIDVDIVGLDVDIQGMIGSLLDPLINSLVNVLKDTLITQFAQEYGQKLPEMIEEALAGLAEGQVIELPPLIGEGEPTPLLLSIAFDELKFTVYGLYIKLNAALTADKGVTYSPLGLIMRDGCMGAETEPFVLPTEDEMNAGIAADFLNEALYSVWYSGAITMELGVEDLKDLVDLTQYGMSDLAISIDLNYAPVVRTCGTGPKLELQLGDAFLHANFFMMNMTWDIKLYMFMVMDAELQLVPNEETGETEIGIKIGELKTAEIDVVEVGQDLKGKEGQVEELFKGVLIPTLMDQALSGLGSFAIPSFDLSGLDPSIPEGTNISVDLLKLVLDKGYLVVGGKLK
jgi:hypothetical protein